MQRGNASHGEHGAEHQHHLHDHSARVGHEHGEPQGHDDGQRAEAAMQESSTEHTCPMHPEVRQLGPGKCPKCGMFLEPVGATTSHAHTPTHQGHGRPQHHPPSPPAPLATVVKGSKDV